ncbi:MAG: hypothetical protein EOP43_05115 [Sphingobacteriaceae bacterium]|nr:MAG: hypothetical protein EOP43_05115 [Sphingobacteriaceae bacterium]
MKIILLSLLGLTILGIVISGYLTFSGHYHLFQDQFLIQPITTLSLGILSTIILLISLKYYDSTTEIVEYKQTLKIGFICSLFFILIATLAWFNKDPLIPDSRYIGDQIWKLGHPLTFLIIDLPIYLRLKSKFLQKFWSDYWTYPSVVTLFIVQFSIYVHGIRLLFNFKKIKNLYNNQQEQSSVVR